MKKFLVESLKLSLLLAAVAYCMFSVGFTSQHSTVNNLILLDACFNHVVSGTSDRSTSGMDELNVNNVKHMEASNDLSLPDIALNNVPGQQSPADSSNRNLTKKDSLFSRSDSLKLIKDSLKTDTTRFKRRIFPPADSAARIKYFKYSRHDLPYVSFQPKKRSKFFAYPSQSVANRTVELDSTGNNVLIKEKIAGKETKILLEVPLDEYIKMRMAANNRASWEGIAYKYEMKKDENELGNLISDITNIDIPLPSAGFLSIFGPPKINIKIGGAVDIHGAWRNETQEGYTASLLGNTRNEPDFKQQVQINVNGTIGDKLKIGADWNTERTFEYENQLKLNYTGYDDEIVKSVEAGNVSLETSPLVGGSEALFGVKANFQMGPLSLTALASQKKGEVKEVSVTGGSSSQTFDLDATDYSKNHYAVDQDYVDTVQSHNLNIFKNYYANATPLINDAYIIDKIEVWKSTNTLIPDPKERNVFAKITLDYRQNNALYDDATRNSSEITPGITETGRFILLTEDVDYELNKYTGVITFKTSIQDDDAIAVAFKRHGGAGGGSIVYGEFTTDFPDTSKSKKLVLKLVKPKNLIPQYKIAWSLQLKNFYPLNARDIQKEGFELDIKYLDPSNNPIPQSDYKGVKLLSAFGLDKYDESQSLNSDGKFDYLPGITILPSTGEIIFPVLQPFGRNLPGNLDPALRFNAVYDTTQTGANNNIQNKFKITGKYSGTSSSTFSIGFNVVENSVKVSLGGRELTAGVDYIVDYNIGQVTIRNDAALAPGADLKITYEQNDLFQLASKTLVGLRGKLNIADKTNLGFSLLKLTQETLSEKVRIGEEPLSNSILGMDFGTEFDLPFLTKGINNLIPTRAMSSLKFNAEFAYMNPTPNTKTSTVTSDNGQSIAYIDDFEGSKKTIPIGVSYSSWHDLSVPTMNSSAKQLSMANKAKSYWYNKLNPSDAYVIDIWGNSKKVAQGDEQVTVLNFEYNPSWKGTYNWDPASYLVNVGTSNSASPDSFANSWGGMMKPLSSTASDLEEENIDFIEFWYNVQAADLKNDTMYIDLGRISEQVIDDSKHKIPNINGIHTEDKNNNGLIDQGEDVGLDGLADADEPGYDAVNNPDPSGDDWKGQYDYPHVNGTEGNAQQQGGNFVDTEDLNRNRNLDKVNSFFRFKVPLDTNKAGNPFRVGGGAGKQPWVQVRIPIRDKKIREEIGNPSLSNVETIRFWFKGSKNAIHVRFAEMNLVGNQWVKVYPKGPDGQPNKNDSIMTVSVINREDNPHEYYTPQGVISEVDHTTKGDVQRNEQSLDLIIKDLPDGQERQAIKYLYKPLDVFSYKQMKLFIHGDDSLGLNSVSYSRDIDTNYYNSEVYFRFGSDTLNYYEYRMPVAGGWHEVSIAFDELTALKEKNDTSRIFINKQAVPGKPGHYYAIKGKPALTSISFFSVGILNPKNKGTSDPISGTVWVNELRVIGADDTKGWAYSTSASLKIADLMNVNFNISRTDPYFHKLSDRFGSRNESSSWGGSIDLDVLKLLPVNLPGSNLRLNYARTEQLAKPLYEPGTDVKIETAALQKKQQEMERSGDEAEANRIANDYINSTRTINTSETWTVAGVKIKVPSNFWLVRETINNFTFGFNFNKTYGRNPTTQKSNTWVWNADIDYSLSFSQKNFFYMTDIPVVGLLFSFLKDYKNLKIYYSPQSFTAGLKATRNYSYSLSRLSNSSQTTSIDANVSRDFKTARNAGFNWMLTDGGLFNLTLAYNLSISNSLAHLLTDVNKIDRSDKEIWHDIFSGAFFGRPFQYQQTFDLRTNPKLPSLWDINKFFTINSGYSVNYNWQNSFEQKDLGRSAAFSSRISAGVNIRLKSLFDPLFKEEKESSNNQPGLNNNNVPSGRERGDRGRGSGRDGNKNPEVQDSSKGKFVEFKSDSLGNNTKSSISKALGLFKALMYWTLFDYETIRLNFSQDNQVQKTGLKSGSSGIANFWGLSQNTNYGPSRLFMLGLSQDVGDRITGYQLTDNVSQKNSLDFSTSRPLWPGAQIELKWNVGWGVNKNSTVTIDSITGKLNIINSSSTGTIQRSFLALPAISFIPILNGGLKKVNELYDPASQNLSEAFVKGFETFPILSKLPIFNNVVKYIPRPNWSITWDGLEKFSIFKSFTKRVSLSHAYSSSYSEGWKIETDGTQTTQYQKVDYGFQPLIGLSMTFNSIWEGNFTGSVKYNTKTAYDLGLQTNNITQTNSSDIGITASYSKSGLEVPIFGIYLKNDIEASFSYTSSNNSSFVFDMSKFDEKGTPQDGQNRTTMEPRIKMVVSTKVTASIFYKRSVTKPLEGSASKIQGTTTNEYGLDVRITIQ